MAHDILIVDDEDDIRTLMAGILSDEGYETRDARDSDSALEELGRRLPSLLALDVWLEGSRLDGMQILERVRTEYPELPVVMISGHSTIEMAVSAIRKGAYDFIEKPFKSDRLLLVAQRAIEAERLRRENAELRLRAGPTDSLIGDSPAMAGIVRVVKRVAPTGSRVMITGPAGAGKEVVAHLIHNQSRREHGPFVAINCATITPERMEEELFGTEAAGNGEGRRVGVFERAHGGTLLLDEVADMPLETQGKIVRVLQDLTFQRVGGSSRVEVDVRVIAASNRDLEAEIAAGHFREDLYYRLAVVPIAVPPLRARREDIPALAEHFLERAAAVSGLSRRAIGADAMAALQAYDWPGNVRQLRNVIDWLLIMAPESGKDVISADMLPPEIGAITPPALSANGSGELMGLPLRDAREVFERQYLEAQMARFSGNISRTATFIGMERSALHRKLKSLGLTMGDHRREAEVASESTVG
ncbi:MAG: sigma-54 dependent transcriptional regulator [Alphaproteobacteria bacterium]